jgi:hypothetical protein
MKNVILSMSLAFMVIAMAGCNSDTREQKKAVDESFRQERSFMDQAIRHRSPDVQRVDIVGNTVVYTHIFDGIIDEKTYTYDGDVCVEAERVYTFPSQMSALRHYRRAVERVELYYNIQLFNNQVKYDLKKQQHELETKGLTKDQLKAKFDKQISDAKADLKTHEDKFRKDVKKDCKGKCNKM